VTPILLFSAFPLSPPLLSVFFLMTRPPPSSTLFPYTTLFRSRPGDVRHVDGATLCPGRPGKAEGGGGQDEGKQGVPVHRGSSFRSEEHTSELQSLTNLVCRLLLEKKKTHAYMRIQHCLSPHYT